MANDLEVIFIFFENFICLLHMIKLETNSMQENLEYLTTDECPYQGSYCILKQV